MSKLIDLNELKYQSDTFNFLKRLSNSDRYKAESLFNQYDIFITHLLGLSNSINGKMELAFDLLLKKREEIDKTKENVELRFKDESVKDITNTFLEHINKLNKSSPMYSSVFANKNTEAAIIAYFVTYDFSLPQQILILKWFIIWRINGLKFNPFTHSENEILYPIVLEMYNSLMKVMGQIPQLLSFENVKIEIEKFNHINLKIKYLIEVITDFKQKYVQFDSDKHYSKYEPNFLKQCELEIEKLKQLTELEIKSNSCEQPSIFILSKKRGNKADLIRILDTLYELQFFQTLEGQYPTKEIFMKHVGIFFGTDFSDYDKDRSQALNASIEANLKIFEQMKDIIQKMHNDKESK